MTDFNKKPGQPHQGSNQTNLNRGPQQGPQAGLNKDKAGTMGGKAQQQNIRPQQYVPNANQTGNKDRGRQ